MQPNLRAQFQGIRTASGTVCEVAYEERRLPTQEMHEAAYAAQRDLNRIIRDFNRGPQ